MTNESLINKWIGAAVREQRILQGATLRGLAHSIGITYQQLQKYENGTNRISAARLITIAQALETPVGELYKGYKGSASAIHHEKMHLELLESLRRISNTEQQAAICKLVKALAEAAA